MRRMKLVLVLLCVLAPLATCQRQERWSTTSVARSKHRDKTAKGKYEPDYDAARRTSRFGELFESEHEFTLSRRSRAIDSNRYPLFID